MEATNHKNPNVIRIALVASLVSWAGFIALTVFAPEILALVTASLFLAGCVTAIVIGWGR